MSAKANERKKRPIVMSAMGWLLTLRALIMPKSTARLTQRMMFTPRKIPIHAVERQWLDAAVKQDLHLDTTRFVTYTWGQGERQVLLVHGWSGGASQMTQCIQGFLDQGFRVVAVDMPAHGASDGSMSSVVHFAKSLMEINQAFGPFHSVLAHSLGAAAVSYALHMGMVVNRLVFVAPLASYVTVWEGFQHMLGLPTRLIHTVRLEAERWLSTRFNDIEPLALAAHMKPPLLVVHDQQDRECPFHLGEQLAKAWPQAQFMATQKLGHGRILRDPDVLRACTEFLSQNISTPD